MSDQPKKRSLNDLREELNATLDTLRNGSMTSFRAIQTLLIVWLRRGREKSRRDLKTSLDLDPEKVARILALEPEQEVFEAYGSPHTETWARCAAWLTVSDDQLTEVLRKKGYEEEFPSAEACLEAIHEIADQQPDMESHRRQLLKRYNDMAAPMRQLLNPDVRSFKRVSGGLRERLRQFHKQIEYLTIQQLDVLEASVRDPRLWVEGPAGSGKTIVAVEAAYRTLNEGKSCAIAYRSTQFRVIFEQLLGELRGNLFLFSHAELLRAWSELPPEERVSGDSRPSFAVGERLVETPPDLLIVDDYSTLAVNLDESFPRWLAESSNRVILLVAPDQCLDTMGFPKGLQEVKSGFRWGPESGTHVLFDPFKMDDDLVVKAPTEAAGTIIRTHAAESPPDFTRVELSRNLRNASRIVKYGRRSLDSQWGAAVGERGVVTAVECSWDGLEAELKDEIEELVSDYSPGQIRLLVDPYVHSLRGGDSASDEWMRQLSPLTRAVARAAGTQASKWMSQDGVTALQRVVNEVPGTGLYLAWTDGQEAGCCPVSQGTRVRPTRRTARRIGQHGGDVQAQAAFSPEFLRDGLEVSNVILGYPTPLYIGLESDAVVYVRNGQDGFDWYATQTRFLDRLREVRKRQHALAISRARFHLVDIAVS